MKTGDFFSVWKKVFSNWKYVLLTIIVAFIFYSLNVFIKNYLSLGFLHNQLGILGSIKIFFTFLVSFKDTVFLSSFISLIIISIFLGILISLIVYKTKKLQEVSGKTGFFATLGIFLGIFAPGCAACGIGLLSLFGISAASLTFLPFKGLEFSILSIIILSVLIFEITKNISNGIVCKTMKGGKRNE